MSFRRIVLTITSDEGALCVDCVPSRVASDAEWKRSRNSPGQSWVASRVTEENEPSSSIKIEVACARVTGEWPWRCCIGKAWAIYIGRTHDFTSSLDHEYSRMWDDIEKQPNWLDCGCYGKIPLCGTASACIAGIRHVRTWRHTTRPGETVLTTVRESSERFPWGVFPGRYLSEEGLSTYPSIGCYTIRVGMKTHDLYRNWRPTWHMYAYSNLSQCPSPANPMQTVH